MHTRRLDRFSRQRLDGHPVPDDLRALLVAQWEGRTGLHDELGITLLDEGDPNPLLGEEDERTGTLGTINAAAHARMAQHLKIFATHEDGDCYGYWMHPEEPADRPTRVIWVDTEGSYLCMSGATCTEAFLWRDAEDDDERFAELVAVLADLGVAISARGSSDLDHEESVLDPHQVYERFVDAELEARGLSRTHPY